jgi:hypothetical protein
MLTQSSWWYDQDFEDSLIRDGIWRFGAVDQCGQAVRELAGGAEFCFAGGVGRKAE